MLLTENTSNKSLAVCIVKIIHLFWNFSDYLWYYQTEGKLPNLPSVSFTSPGFLENISLP
jgi:hypothetical protein